MEKTLEQLQYPIGRFAFPAQVSEEEIKEAVHRIAVLPLRMLEVVRQIPPDKLDTPYRPGGWTIRQVVHHVADSHINAYCRFKVTLTEDNPTLKTYEEQYWAEMHDVKKLPINISITLLHALHARWHEALKYVKDDEWNNRTAYHPGLKKTVRLWFLLGMYAWHGRHHTAHITSLRERMKW